MPPQVARTIGPTHPQNWAIHLPLVVRCAWPFVVHAAPIVEVAQPGLPRLSATEQGNLLSRLLTGLAIQRGREVPPIHVASLPNNMGSILLGFHFNLLALVHSIIETKHHSKFYTAPNAEDKKERARAMCHQYIDDSKHYISR